MSEGVLKLAGEFVANFYHLIVSDQFADVIHLYKEDAVVTRGTEGAKASSPKDIAAELSGFHHKVKAATAEILSIDALQLETQQIVITVAVVFKQLNLLTVQTLVLEAKVEDEETSWYVASDATRFLTLPHGAHSANTRTTKPKVAKHATAAAKPEAPKEEKPAQVEAAAAPASVAAPVAAPVVESAPAAVVESAPVAVTTHVHHKKTTAKKSESHKASAAAPATAAAPASTTSAPVAEKKEEKSSAPKSWANVAGSKAEPSAAPAATTATSAPVTATAAKNEKKPAHKTVHPIAVSAVTPSGAVSTEAHPVANGSTAAAASAHSAPAGELHVYARANGAATREAVEACFAEFAPVRELEMRTTPKGSNFTVALTSDDAAALFAKISARAPLKTKDGFELKVEVSRSAPNSRAPRTAGASSSHGSRQGSSSGPRRSHTNTAASSSAPKKE